MSKSMSTYDQLAAMKSFPELLGPDNSFLAPKAIWNVSSVNTKYKYSKAFNHNADGEKCTAKKFPQKLHGTETRNIDSIQHIQTKCTDRLPSLR